MKFNVELVRIEKKEDRKRVVLVQVILFYIAHHQAINLT
jgi:hypothetical protein